MTVRPSHKRSSGKWLIPALPYLWLTAFFFVPFLIVLKISLSQTAIAQPPYTPVLDLAAGWTGLRTFFRELSLSTYALLIGDDIYLLSYLKSLQIATLSTLVLVLTGVPIAYGMARAPARAQPVLLVLVILPFWTSFLIRVYAWMGILKDNGLLNGFLMRLGLIDHPIMILNTQAAVLIGMVYAYLPFLVLPLYATLEKLDWTLLEAAADLGAHPWSAFFRVTLPLSAPGTVAGALLVFVPACGEFVIPELLGSAKLPMIGTVLWTEFFSNRDWPAASAIAVALLLVLAAPILLIQRRQASGGRTP